VGGEWPSQACVLVVDDHDAVRAMAVKTLRVRGYAVIEAPGGHEALQAAAVRDRPIALLLTDVDMPGMNGLELAHKLIAQRPGLRVLFVSGDPEPSLPPDAHFLLKPFTPTALAEAVRRALESPAPQADP